MKKSFSEHEKKVLALARSLFLFFWAGIFLCINITINGFDLLHDFIGHLFAIAGAFSLLSSYSLLEKKYKIFSWAVSVIVFLSFIAYIVNQALLNQTNAVWNSFVAMLFPIFLVTFVYIGMGISKKFAEAMLVHWKRLFFIFFVFLLVIIGMQLVSLAASETFEAYSVQLTGIYPILFLIGAIILTIYSFTTVWGTYKYLRKSVNK